jgi:hypothetical protein
MGMFYEDDEIIIMNDNDMRHVSDVVQGRMMSIVLTSNGKIFV